MNICPGKHFQVLEPGVRDTLARRIAGLFYQTLDFEPRNILGLLLVAHGFQSAFSHYVGSQPAIHGIAEQRQVTIFKD